MEFCPVNGPHWSHSPLELEGAALGYIWGVGMKPSLKGPTCAVPKPPAFFNIPRHSLSFWAWGCY